MYIEPEKELKEAVDRAADEFAGQALANSEEATLIFTAMQRAMQVILNYQRERQSTKR